MNITGIIIAAAVVGIVGIVIGILLGIASEKFKVEVDEREILVRAELPGNNCGGCGYAGCDALAKAIVDGKAKVNQCPVGGASVGDKIAAIMGVEAGAAEKMVAFVKCKGTCDKANVQYNYYGMDDCVKIAAAVPGAGDKACSYGCLGSGTGISRPSARTRDGFWPLTARKGRSTRSPGRAQENDRTPFRASRWSKWTMLPELVSSRNVW